MKQILLTTVLSLSFATATVAQEKLWTLDECMRYAVENAFDRGNLREIEKLFGYTVDKDKGKPSNREYIARMADSLRLQQA